MFTLLFVLVIVGQSLGSPSSRIIGGEPADIEEYPYQCSLRYSGSHTCGCVIISPTKVLTAAHCIDGRATSSFEVYAGSTSRLTGGVLRNVETAHQHEHYDDGSGTFANDIAVLVLSSAFDLQTNIQPGDLAQNNNHDFDGENCILTGWGRTSSSSTIPEQLMQVTSVALSTGECRAAMSGMDVDIQNMHICVITSTKDGGSCSGDSGGPMQCGGKIAGVTSWGISGGGDCLATYPSVYTRVSNYYDWISSK